MLNTLSVLAEFEENGIWYGPDIDKYPNGERVTVYCVRCPPEGQSYTSKEIVIPPSAYYPTLHRYINVNIIGVSAFKNCTALESIKLPERIKSIQSCAFQGCTGLTSFKIPENVERIGSWAFKDCTSLKSITIPNCIDGKGINDDAFEGCTALSKITISFPKPLSIDNLYAHINLFNKQCPQQISILVSRFLPATVKSDVEAMIKTLNLQRNHKISLEYY